MIKKIFRSIVLSPIKIIGSKYQSVRVKNLYKNKILKYYSDNFNENQLTKEKREVIEYIKKNTADVFPYEYTKEHGPMKLFEIKVYKDEELNLPYVSFEDKKMYFPKGMSDIEIKLYYKAILREQDPRSPHCYLYNDFKINEGDVVVDIGVAEGNFALSIIEKAKKVYLFECDEKWIEALEATFKPWNDKVEIIKKFVSDNNEKDNITLDAFFSVKSVQVNFIKIDAEGAESSILIGSKNIIRNSENIRIAACTYHNQDDAKILKDQLLKRGFKTNFSRGYMIFLWDSKLSEPYLRRGLIRATKI